VRKPTADALAEALAALDNAGNGIRPGPEWKSANEWAALKDMPKSTAQNRLARLVQKGTWEARLCGRTTFYRMKP